MEWLRRWRTSAGLVWAYLIGAMLLVLSPVPLTRPLVPLLDAFDTVMQNLVGLPPGTATFLLQFTANVALFVPPALLLALRMRRDLWSVVIVAGFVCAVAIEFLQLAVLPGRSPTASDILANTLGAVVGVWISLRMRR